MALMALADVLAQYEDGDEHGWGVEFHYLLTEHADQMRDLIASIQERGIQRPVMLGSDGRVWDGHHRLCAATVLRLGNIPVELA